MSSFNNNVQNQSGATYWLIAYLAYMLVPFIGELSWWFFLIFATISSWRILIIRLGWNQPGMLSRTTLTILLFLIIYKTQGGVLGRDSGVALLVVMLSLKLLELRTQRDYIIATLLGFLLILGNFLFSQSLLLSLYLLGGVIFGFACLYRINYGENISLGNRFSLASRLLLISLPLMLILYFLFPRLPIGLFGLPSGSGATTGLSDSMSPGSINSLASSNKPAFYAEFEDSQRVKGPFYWRAILLWHYDGRTWRRQTPFINADYNIKTNSRPLKYEIIMEQDTPWIPSLDMAIKGPARSRLLPGMIYRWPMREVRRRRYQLTSVPSYEIRDLYQAEKAAALQLPSTSRRVKKLVSQWKSENKTDKDIVNAALRYFRTQEFYYTLKPPLLGGDPVDEFLFDRRQGFCEHYSSAFVILMRQAGIPARVVNGFLGADYNNSGGFYTVRQSDAHAWAEVWLNDSGWVRVDPTSAVAPERIEYGIEAIRRMQETGLSSGQASSQQILDLMQSGFLGNIVFSIRQQWERVNVGWYRWTEGFDSQRQKQFMDSLKLPWPAWVTHIVAIAACMIIAAAFAVLLSMRRPFPVDPCRRIYDHFCKTFARKGAARAPHEGPYTYGQRLITDYPSLAEEISRFLFVYITSAYGPGKPDINRLKIQYRQLEQAVQKLAT